MPIIDPWLIYILVLIQKLHLLNNIIMLFSILAIILNIDEKFRIKCSMPFVMVAITVCIAVFAPSQEVIIRMIIAKNITTDNVAIAEVRISEIYNEIIRVTDR